MKKNQLLLFFSFSLLLKLTAQLPAECQLDFGMNLGGLADYGTELPFVDLMKNARQWYTKDIGNPNAPFNSGNASHLSYRPDGYPTHMPQSISQSAYDQEVATIWADIQGWPAGQYVLLWEGTGSLRLWGSFSNLTTTGPGRMILDVTPQAENAIELTIETSDINDPIRNIRLLMPGTEFTYQQQPFNPVFINQMQNFQTVRFMDWGQTNNWGQKEGESWDNPNEFAWAERSQMDHYTWSYEKGIPYEMMIKLMNDYDLDGWLCVPHRASPAYMQALADLFRDNLESDRHLYVEYSNETWNWIFGQAQWLNKYGCTELGISWPEGIVPYVQRCMDAFTTSFAGQTHRITRVVGTQLSWVDVSQRIANNMTPGSFDAITPTCYFGFNDAGDTALDNLGAAATVADVAFYARQAMPENFNHVREQKELVADPLGLPMLFYEGGQHLTPHPFGVQPTYEQALIDLQRDPAMFDLYQSWFDSLRTLQTGGDPLKIMHFSFVSRRSAQYGSWGLLETMDQDTNLIPAPKFSAVLRNMASMNCSGPLAVEWGDYQFNSNQCEADLAWTTRKEENNSHFEIHRSTDGAHFKLIHQIAASPAATEGGNYQYQDRYLPNGRYYYRIDQVDYDGSRSTMGIHQLTIDCKDKTYELDIYPNPAYDRISLQSRINTSGNLIVYNINGQQVIQQQLETINGNSVDISHLPSGVYTLLLQAVDTTEFVSKRFIKH